MRILLRVLAVIGFIYIGGLALIAWAMTRPPAQFGQIMKHVPGPAFMVLPFEPMWMRARAGTLEVGEQAPDFTLPTIDRSQHVTLSEHRGERPVVLVFGSYT